MKKALKSVICCISVWIFCISFDMISLTFAAAENTALYQAKGRRDPFVQLVSAGTAQRNGSLLAVEMPEDLVVEGIACDGQQGCIVIANGTVLREGESAGNVKAVKVRADGALFTVSEVEVFKPVYQQEEQKAQTPSS